VAGEHYTDIRFEVTDHVALITLDRPDVLNAFSSQMGRELDDACGAATARRTSALS
jgi:enoyl-CoA hydratase/carnithine racemase